MQIELKEAGKRFNREWIFKGINYIFTVERPTVILGSNGSGKSTLMQTISLRSMLSEGEIVYRGNDGDLIPIEQCYKAVALAAPYLELIEEYTLTELVKFYLEHKLFQQKITIRQAIEIMQLERSADKAIRYFSSGMKQRTKLALAILSETPILLLDEPTSNLDHLAMLWYRKLIEEYAKDRIIVVCSNHQTIEYDFCIDQLVVEDFKPTINRH
ncbi:MAG: ABC transporter ATP-binding protein [Bacteroidetes bacterium HGW-Bacteroidetes-22]|nr:MAG: ABC transporter ATP-binding protein [Bacteroidetes bacterium HGW-Bacteroidetes-22]